MAFFDYLKLSMYVVLDARNRGSFQIPEFMLGEGEILVFSHGLA